MAEPISYYNYDRYIPYPPLGYPAMTGMEWQGLSIPERAWQVGELAPVRSYTPEELYGMQTAPALQQAAQQAYNILNVPTPYPAWGFGMPLQEPAEQARRVLQTAAMWAPGAEGVGERRTMGQQTQMEREVGNLMNWMPSETGYYSQFSQDEPVRSTWAMWTDERERAIQEANQRAWKALQPMLTRVLSPEERPGGVSLPGETDLLASPKRYGFFPPTMAAPTPTPIAPRRRYAY